MNITNTTTTLKKFFDKFAPSWASDSVPVGTAYPYATFTVNSQAFHDEGLIQLRFYTQSSSIEEVCALTDKLEAEIGHAGKLLEGEGGYLWLYKGNPWAQIEPTPHEELKVMYINLSYRNY